MSWLLLGGLGLLATGLVLLWVSWHLRRRAGMPVGRVIYSDTRAWRECPEPLYAPSVNLAGKPDYLVQRWKYVLPIEVKSCSAPAGPYPSHVLQLAAYCLLVEETYGLRPPYRMIRYPDRTFAVK
jgi:CRISPR-associated exonuclease Cas4